ncbi:MAG: hypothetical protein COW19_10310 [Zetaproteobacteria bacterium CG12_big_fil_rev_8_21_14_0_65_55_1124]|nr:MAG: hypothetical protein COT53_10220 [Zetaproteobacteria bacterium CG08_land_8_20_14_0_20_55_17]PIW42032.1 MAG: hypothetical protein COW19_10310 [Zetaproteobacteria bacterium CG12_big_fil_rev_8_21_14_0_65_55_1124]PIY53938.1 MAG: hypothetical protein COZ01_02135 [Zetaproteobacteria bacterium CG_4_10_14_0_8_um_filter_55_43]PIZ39383.1 MAG: hypothetical protein COY36_03170 [Zetaproteobacteria bacterium CG_4_10_14_0_2_um_filter_55_20]PJB80739.1 MAG: hypothetical protein CO089_06530 [Zetaproteoba
MCASRAEDLKRCRILSCLAASFALFALALTLAPQSSLADDMDRVRELRSTSSIMPLSQLLQEVEKQYPGTLLEVELEEEKGRVIYEMELLGEDRVVRTLKVNARNGKILSVDRED